MCNNRVEVLWGCNIYFNFSFFIEWGVNINVFRNYYYKIFIVIFVLYNNIKINDKKCIVL